MGSKGCSKSHANSVTQVLLSTCCVPRKHRSELGPQGEGERWGGVRGPRDPRKLQGLVQSRCGASLAPGHLLLLLRFKHRLFSAPPLLRVHTLSFPVSLPPSLSLLPGDPELCDLARAGEVK